MKLIKYRDWGTSTYTYFWASEDDKVLSPYFNLQEDAEKWLKETYNSLSKGQDVNE